MAATDVLDGKKVVRVPYIWVDNDLSFARGHIQGFPKKLGVISVTRAVTVGRGDPLVRDLARNIVTDFAVADVWTGRAELELFDSEFEELAALRPVQVTGGFRCALAFSVTGAEIRH
jgi:acetoacetate decarboxylase